MGAEAESELVRVLLVEDDEDDFLLTRDLLDGQDRTKFTLDWAASFEQARDRIRAGEHDIYLIDHRLGKETGLELVRQSFGNGAVPPVIMLTGYDDYEVDLEANLLGVTDFLLKSELSSTLIERSIRYALRHHTMVSELRQTQDRYALAVRGANDGIWDWDLERDRIHYASRWKAFLGCSDDEIGDSPDEWFSRVHPDDVGPLRRALAAHLEGESSHLESEHRMRHADHNYRWMFARGVAVRSSSGRATRIAGSMSDITARKSAEDRLRYDALHDPLTGLPNRTMFLDHLELSLRRGTRDPSYRCAVLFMDLNRFKLINDAYSHAVGDELLIALARRLTALMRPGDTVARLGGDEFTVLLDRISDTESAIAITDRIQTMLAEPFEVEGRDMVVTAAVGIAISEPASTADELMRDADIAMYEVKNRGELTPGVFSSSMRRRVVSQLELETELREAIEQRSLRVYYQPIFEIASGRLAGLEALARWPGESSRDVSPAQFIPVAESTGLIWDLTRLMLDASMRDLACWREQDLVDEAVSISVNVSGNQLGEQELIEDVHAALEAHDVSPSALRLEITESTIMREPERMPAALDELEGVGVKVHIDDFGTGYSSLTFLRHFSGRTLKIDRSFVSSMGSDIGSEEIVRTVVALARTLDLEVIAEGVETNEQLRLLRELGCGYAQGFLFSRPAPAGEIEPLLEGWRSGSGAAAPLAGLD